MNKFLLLVKSNFILVLIIIIAFSVRLWKIDTIPPSMYYDELDLGYQAYSILNTGRDYFGNLLPLHPHSFAEYRTPFNIYTAIPTVWLFGINAYGVRLPSVIFGVLGVFGFYLLIRQLLISEDKGLNKLKDANKIALLGALVLTISPWHIQFSRVTLEVSALVFFLTFGLYLFFKSLRTSRYLWLSALFLILTPWIYSTAKLFIPFFLLFILVNWKKEIFRLPKVEIIKAIIALLIVGLPMVYMTLSGKAGSRFSYISIFTDPTVATEVNFSREFDTVVRGENWVGAKPNFSDKFFHNKPVYWIKSFTGNILSAFSTEFLFSDGDINLRHSLKGVGQFYRIEALTLILGMVLFFTKKSDIKIKRLFLFWLIAGVIPYALTRDGSTHAARLIIILPPLIVFIAYGLIGGLKLIKAKFRFIALAIYAGIWLLEFTFYTHNYLIHYPWESERWWNAGYKEMVDEIKIIEDEYEKIIITTADEPPLVFFAAYYPYDSAKWQTAVKNGTLTGEADGSKKIDKYYFDQYRNENLHEILCSKCVYIASAREVEYNLIMEPNKNNKNLNLIKSITLPSGEPAFYFFTKRED